MTRPLGRLRRLEATMPPVRELPQYDITRLTPEQRERCAVLNERCALVGMDGLTIEEVEEGAAYAEILLAPEWPIPEKRPVPRDDWRSSWPQT